MLSRGIKIDLSVLFLESSSQSWTEPSFGKHCQPCQQHHYKRDDFISGLIWGGTIGTHPSLLERLHGIKTKAVAETPKLEH